jgi:rSAM/selenodomain-associated transferase 1
VRPVILIFAKAPLPGHVKTRLLLDPEVAVALHSALVRDTVEGLAAAYDVELHVDRATDAWPELTVPRAVQALGDLGTKMLAALDRSLRQSRERALVLGSDTPALPLSHIDSLLGTRSDVALGPSEDGGFYAISCRRTHPAMFENIPWSSPETLAATLRAIERCGLTVETGPSWFDIDEPESLKRLHGLPGVGSHTARWLRDRSEAGEPRQSHRR